ncbi:YiiG family protein [Xenorhabdus sp. IM139775]|uniref:YiiG family protein n=1 Tax=Xenorhabdus sp. IM139775 TaxID=3025876 RepID=UPI0023593887|nr:YiiG family protein [Xenorhabdus sp. IM139775]MDC9592548.1 YiiG family protein [Xenorhabdus sp. IM139775]
MDFNDNSAKWKKGIIALCIALALSACDNKKEESASLVASTSSPETAQNNSAGEKGDPQSKEAKNEPVQDREQVISEKMQTYIKCYNLLDESIHKSLFRYSSWLDDLEKGPTGKERVIYGLYSVNQTNIADCQKKIQKVAAMEPKLKPIDDIAASYIDLSAKVVLQINGLERYYTQEDYKDDVFAKGKEKHPQLISSYTAFSPVSMEYSEAIEKMNDERQQLVLQQMEKEGNLTLEYYSLTIIFEAKKIKKMVKSKDFDAVNALAMVAELQNKAESMLPLIAELKESRDLSYMGYESFLRNTDEYAKAAKERIRRIRDKVPYTSGEKMSMGGMGEWMVDGSPGKLLKAYNTLIDEFNRI